MIVSKKWTNSTILLGQSTHELKFKEVYAKFESALSISIIFVVTEISIFQVRYQIVLII